MNLTTLTPVHAVEWIAVLALIVLFIQFAFGSGQPGVPRSIGSLLVTGLYVVIGAIVIILLLNFFGVR